jgi:hypothetical protein
LYYIRCRWISYNVGSCICRCWSSIISNSKCSTNTTNEVLTPKPTHRKIRLRALPTHKANTQSPLWYCSQFLTVILFVAMLPTLLAHCLFHFVPQPKSQANTKHSNKKTLRSNHHHHFAYASIKTA